MKPWMALARTFERNAQDVIVSRWPLSPAHTSTRRKFVDLEEDEMPAATEMGEVPVNKFPKPACVVPRGCRCHVGVG